MFKTFTRTEKSWGNAAHITPEAMDKILASGNSLKKINPVNSKSSKPFKAWKTETLKVERKSKDIIIHATSQDRAFDEARAISFEPIPNEAFDEVAAVLKKHGYSIIPGVTTSIHRVK